MSPVLLHDSGRSGTTTWACGVIRDGTAAGFILSPFSTPRDPIPRNGTSPRVPGAAECRTALEQAGGEVLFDPTTHGAMAPGADLFRLYDTWGLWAGPRGATTAASLLAHVDRVLDRCSALRLRPITPTLRLDAPTGPLAERAYRMAEHAVEIDEEVIVAIVGSSGFWSSGAALDAYVGELVQLQPGTWSITVTRNALRYPWPGLDPAEVGGMCRTAHSLSMRGADVIASHNDLAALPLIAAGATHVGSGWDQRHRVCADDMFRAASGVRRASPRVTHRGLLASLKRDEAEALLAADAALSSRLVQGALPPDHNAHWRHHLRVLNGRVDRVADAGDREDRVVRLRDLYERADRDFDRVHTAVGRLEAGKQQWIQPLRAGLNLYAEDEGW